MFLLPLIVRRRDDYLGIAIATGATGGERTISQRKLIAPARRTQELRRRRTERIGHNRHGGIRGCAGIEADIGKRDVGIRDLPSNFLALGDAECGGHRPVDQHIDGAGSRALQIDLTRTARAGLGATRGWVATRHGIGGDGW